MLMELINGVRVEVLGTHIIVACPTCGKSRQLAYRSLSAIRHGEVSGNCKSCAGKASRPSRSDDELLPDSSVIHWGNRDRSGRVCVTCGVCKKSRHVYMTNTGRKRGTGKCGPCGAAGKQNSPPSGHHHPRWKGGYTTSCGYVMIHLSMLDTDDRRLASKMTNGKYIAEHRLVMARHVNRPLLWPGDVVHHLNGAKGDNRMQNLRLVTCHNHNAENKATIDALRDEICRLQSILDRNEICYS